MAVTEEELQKLRDANEKLQEQIADAKSTQASREADATREIEAVQLQTENARLQAQLTVAREAAKVGTIKDGASGPLEAAKEQLKVAETQVTTATALPVDTNADSKPADEKKE